MTLEDLTFHVGGARCAASLYHPKKKHTGRAPCVVMAHGTTGTRNFGLPAYAERFAAAGFAVLTFDYRHFGASEGEPRQVVDVCRQLQDVRAAIDFAAVLPTVDSGRLALWGTSLGAGHAVTIAAADQRIQAVVAQLPFMGIDRHRQSPRSTSLTATLFGRAVRDTVRGWRRKRLLMMPMLGEPGDVAVFTGTDDYNAIRDLGSAAPEWRNEIAARSLFSLVRYRPVRAAHLVKVPLLVLVVEADTAASTQLAAQAAE